MDQTLGIYIHIPFCIRKCSYCGFVSQAVDEEMKGRYVDCLLKEIEQRAPALRKNPVDSIFFGGGTPSLLSVQQIEAVLARLRLRFCLTEDCEITMEANPGTVSPESLAGYRSAGVNRLSFGVQSMNDGLLAGLGRIHRAQDAVQSVCWARAAGFDNLNLDLMFGIPAQDMRLWTHTLQEAAALSPEHISFYSLQVEEGTALYDDIKYGRMQPLTDEEDRQMYHEGLSWLKSRGYEQYEISNGAKPGRACRHNLKYWTMQEYAGFGLAAHSFLSGVRSSNTESLFDYIKALQAGRLPTVWSHANTQEEMMEEFVFTGLRQICGISLAEFRQRFGVDFHQVYQAQEEELQAFCRDGFVCESGGRMYLTERGMDISNRIMALFV